MAPWVEAVDNLSSTGCTERVTLECCHPQTSPCIRPCVEKAPLHVKHTCNYSNNSKERPREGVNVFSWAAQGQNSPQSHVSRASRDHLFLGMPSSMSQLLEHSLAWVWLWGHLSCWIFPRVPSWAALGVVWRAVKTTLENLSLVLTSVYVLLDWSLWSALLLDLDCDPWSPRSLSNSYLFPWLLYPMFFRTLFKTWVVPTWGPFIQGFPLQDADLRGLAIHKKTSWLIPLADICP